MRSRGARSSAGIALAFLVIHSGGCRKDTALRPTQVAAPSPFIRQSSSEFSVSVRSEVSVDKRHLLDFSLAGRLLVQPARAANNAGELFQLTFQADRHEASQAEDDLGEVSAELAEPLYVEFLPGNRRILRQAKEQSPMAVALWRTLLSGLDLPTVDASGKAQATTEGNDASGNYQAEFVPGTEPGRWQKRKLSYGSQNVRSRLAADISMEIAPKVIESHCDLKVAEEGVREVLCSEELVTALGDKREASGKTQLSLSLVKTVAARPMEVGAVLAKAQTLGPGGPSASPSHGTGLGPAQIGNYTFESAFAVLSSDANDAIPLAAPKDGTGDRVARHNGAFLALGAIIRTQPNALPKARKQLHADAAKPNRLLLNALAAAGNAEAQALLLEVARGEKFSTELRLVATESLFAVEQPSAETLRDLALLLDDATVGDVAPYALGTLARRAREQNDEALSAAGAKALVDHLAKATDGNDKLRTLRGIANSGFSGALASVRPFLADADDGIRAAAMDAVRLMDVAEVDAIIEKSLRTEGATVVVRSALSAARMRKASEPLVQALGAVALGSKDAGNRLAAVELMKLWQEELPVARSLLAKVAAGEANESIRKAALPPT
jgi:hypothetical protein